MDSLGTIRGIYSERDPDTIRGVVVHTTGGGLWRRWAKDNPGIKPDTIPTYEETRLRWHEWEKRKGHEPHPFDTAIRVFATMQEAGPYMLVCGDTGRICRMSPLDRVAWHVGRSGRKTYEHGVDNDHWLARWPYRSPLGLLGSHQWDEANMITAGIEVAPCRSGHTEPWSQACIDSLNWIVNAHLTKKAPSFTPRANSVVSHWDLHPNVRSLASGLPWDPYDRQWLPAKKALLAEIS